VGGGAVGGEGTSDLADGLAVTMQRPTICGVRIPKFSLLVVLQILIQDPRMHP